MDARDRGARPLCAGELRHRAGPLEPEVAFLGEVNRHIVDTPRLVSRLLRVRERLADSLPQPCQAVRGRGGLPVTALEPAIDKPHRERAVLADDAVERPPARHQVAPAGGATGDRDRAQPGLLRLCESRVRCGRKPLVNQRPVQIEKQRPDACGGKLGEELHRLPISGRLKRLPFSNCR